MNNNYYSEEIMKESPQTKKVVKHLKGDIKTYKEEAQEDRDLMKDLKGKKKSPKKSK